MLETPSARNKRSMADISENNKRIAKNTMALYFRMLFMTLIGLYTSRVILDKLGEVDYGIYNVVGGFVTMFTVISGTMTTATQRYLSFEIGLKDKGNVQSIFNTMVWIHLLFAIIVLILAETIGLWFLNSHMNFPVERHDAANWVFQYSLIAFLLSICMAPYNGALIAYEKMSAFAYFSILEAVIKLAICFVITITAFDKLSTYAFLIMVTQITLMACYFFYCKKHFVQCKISNKLDKQIMSSIFSFFGWNLIGALAMVLKDQGVNVVLNIFFGPVVNAARGISYQVLSKINGFVSNFQMAMNPQIIKNYAAEQKDAMYKLVFRGAKFSYLMLLTLSLPIIFEAPLILSFWLKKVPENTVIFLRIIMFTALLNTLSNPLIISMHASGIIRDFQIVVGGVSLLTLPLVYYAFKLGYDAYIGLIIAFIVEFCCHLTRLSMLKRTIGFPASKFFFQVTLRIILITLLTLVLPWLTYSFVSSNIPRFFSVCIVSVFSCITFGFYGGLENSERQLVISKLHSFINHTLHK